MLVPSTRCSRTMCILTRPRHLCLKATRSHRLRCDDCLPIFPPVSVIQEPPFMIPVLPHIRKVSIVAVPCVCAPALSHCTRWFYPHRLMSVEYLSDPEVQEALHVGASSLRGKLGYTGEWAQCNDLVNEAWSFTDFLADTTYLYSRIYNHAKKPDGFKMLVFSGDNDGVSLCVLCILSVSVPPG